jgi:hypothetical protein
MTIKETILKSLEDIGDLTNYNDITNHIITKSYIDFKVQKPHSFKLQSNTNHYIKSKLYLP